MHFFFLALKHDHIYVSEPTPMENRNQRAKKSQIILKIIFQCPFMFGQLIKHSMNEILWCRMCLFITNFAYFYKQQEFHHKKRWLNSSLEHKDFIITVLSLTFLIEALLLWKLILFLVSFYTNKMRCLFPHKTNIFFHFLYFSPNENKQQPVFTFSPNKCIDAHIEKLIIHLV